MTLQTFTHRYIASDQPTTLLLLHGTGGNEDSLISLGKQIAPDAALLSPRGKVLEGQMPRFFRRFSESVIDEKDLIFRTHELADWLEAAFRDYKITPESLIAVGYSNGANIASSLLMRRPDLVKRAVLLRPMLLPAPDETPNLSGSAALILAGISDHLLPLDETEKMGQQLQNFGAQVTFVAQPAGHGLINADLNAASDWVQAVWMQTAR